MLVLLARNRDLIATVPGTIAAGWATVWSLVTRRRHTRELPFLMRPVELNLHRRDTTANTGALEWFQTTVARVIDGSSGDFAAIHRVSDSRKP